MKIEKYELLLRVADEKDPLFRSPARGALMHGVLMEAVNNDDLHALAGTRPFAQYLSRTAPGEYVWSVSLLHEEKSSAIKRWLHTNPAKLFIEYHNLDIDICAITCAESLSYEEMLSDVLAELPPKYVSFDFITAMIFKRSAVKNPWPFPEPRLILQSILSRWNAFSDAAVFDDEEILSEANQFISLHSYKIQSQRVAMDGVMFAGTTGSASFNVQKTELRQLMNLAGHYAEFSGVGAKTAMGLGAVHYCPGLFQRKHTADAIAAEAKISSE